jgi:xanthine dehydrogenase accessory factor
MIDCYQQLAAALTQGTAVLATVIRVKGSVPREVGAKMIVCANGQILNTIGGGAGEAKVIRQAMQVLQTGEKQRVDIDLTGAPQRETEGVCGGQMQVWLERWQGQDAMTRVGQILTALQKGQPVTLVTPFALDQSPYLIPPSQIESYAIPNAFVETLQPPPTLLIVGAGHVGEQLAKIAHLSGFQIVIQDDRPDWANAERYPQAGLISHDPIATLLNQFALVTRGYRYDLDALGVLLHRQPPCRYLGMIGSEKRVRQVYQTMQQQGIPSASLQTVYAPIGLDIGALTPAEIAISICAELIQVRRGGTGQSLSNRIRG